MVFYFPSIKPILIDRCLQICWLSSLIPSQMWIWVLKNRCKMPPECSAISWEILDGFHHYGSWYCRKSTVRYRNLSWGSIYWSNMPWTSKVRTSLKSKFLPSPIQNPKQEISSFIFILQMHHLHWSLFGEFHPHKWGDGFKGTSHLRSLKFSFWRSRHNSSLQRFWNPTMTQLKSGNIL